MSSRCQAGESCVKALCVKIHRVMRGTRTRVPRRSGDGRMGSTVGHNNAVASPAAPESSRARAPWWIPLAVRPASETHAGLLSLYGERCESPRSRIRTGACRWDARWKPGRGVSLRPDTGSGVHLRRIPGRF
jgi:hypothetical protein